MKKPTKILFIASHLDPFSPIKGGDAQRTHLLLQACAMLGETDVICFSNNVISDIANCNIIYSKEIAPKNEEKKSKLKKWMPIIQFYKIKSLFPTNEEKAEVIRYFLNKAHYDYIVIHYLPKAMECGLLDFKDKLIVDVDDLPTEEFRMLSHESTSLSGKIRNYLFSQLARIDTNHILKKIKYSFFSNEQQIYKKQAAYLPNIPFHHEITSPPIDFNTSNKRIFFVGDLGYYPNYHGVDHFLKFIYAPLQQKINDIEFYIAGPYRSNYDQIKSWESYPNVKVLGYVQDLAKEYAMSRVVVVPIYIGAGTNIKVIEALQMNRACIVSKFASRGYQKLKDNIDFCIAQNDLDFIEKLSQLLTNEQMNQQIATNGNAKTKQYYSFSTYLEIVKQAFL